MLVELIKEGELMKINNYHSSEFGNYVQGEDYEKWIAKCIIFLEDNYWQRTITQRFINASKDAVGNDVMHYDTMMGIIKGISEMGA